MANKPVMGTYTCPHCNKGTPVIWNGNIKNLCIHCNSTFIAKRQKLLSPIQKININSFTGEEGLKYENEKK